MLCFGKATSLNVESWAGFAKAKCEPLLAMQTVHKYAKHIYVRKFRVKKYFSR